MNKQTPYPLPIQKTNFFVENFILPFIKTHHICEENCELDYKIFRKKIYFVREKLSQRKPKEAL